MQITTIFIVFVLAFVVSLLSTRLSIGLALRFGLVDTPDGHRKTHARPVPRLGGPAVFVAFFVPLIVLLWFADRSKVAWVLVEKPRELVGIFVGSGLALVLGIIDDRFDLRARWKALWQVLTGSLMCVFGFGIVGITNPFGGVIMFGAFAYPITVLWFVACMNAVNLADGMDGLAAGICLFVGLTLFFLSLQLGNVLGLLLMACLSGSVLGFLIFNFPPARIFLGDSGSMLLGFLIAALSLVAGKKAEAAVALFIPIVALGLPVLDTGLAIVRRWYKKMPVSSPDREHIHHILVAMGFSHRRAVIILYGMCLLLGAVALVLTLGRGEVVLLVVIFLVIMVYTSLRIFGGMGFRDLMDKASRDRTERARSLNALTITQRAVVEMAVAPNIDALWDACSRVFEILDVQLAKLTLAASAGSDSRELSWGRAENGSAEPGPHDIWSATLTVTSDDAVVGKLEIVQEALPGHALADTSDMLHRMRTQLGMSISRLSQTTAK
ncbi:glycosyltransferase family 4 protein [Verrucomicrobiota bacterium]